MEQKVTTDLVDGKDSVNMEFPPRRLVEVVTKVADVIGLEVTTASGDWIVELSGHNQVHHIFGYNFSLNSSTTYLLCNDKPGAAMLLTKNGVPTVEHVLVLNPNLVYCSPTGAWKPIQDIAKRCNWNVVLKPKDGTGGTNVFHTKTARELEEATNMLFSTAQDLCICPYYEIKHEYRAIVLDGKIELIYRKDRPHLTGDGTSSLFELLHQFLKTLPDRESNSLLSSIDNSSIFHKQKTNGKGHAFVPDKGETIGLNWKHNLGSGSTSVVDIEPSKKEQLEMIALKAMKALNAVFASVDIVDCKLPTQEKTELRIMEVNSGIMMESFVKHHPHLAGHCRNIYAKAVCKMFGLEFEDYREQLDLI